jgi:hypothetical protein
MRKDLVVGMVLALGACASGGGAPPPPAPLAGDREQPVLALFEHVLTGYFAAAGASGPTTCARLSPDPLSAEQEQELIVRFVRLAPAERCVSAAQGTVDAITGAPAQVVQLYQFACQVPGLCSGWVAAPGAPATRYAMRFGGGAWRFDSDRRIIAQ